MVNLYFLEEMLISRGFGPRWTSWVMKLVRGRSICIRLNDENSPFLSVARVLGRGAHCPLFFLT
jgi:hypothetical protein